MMEGKKFLEQIRTLSGSVQKWSGRTIRTLKICIQIFGQDRPAQNLKKIVFTQAKLVS